MVEENRVPYVYTEFGEGAGADSGGGGRPP